MSTTDSNAWDMSMSDMYAGYKDIGSIKSWLYDWGGANEWLFLKINSIQGQGYDLVMTLLSYLGSHHNFLYYMGAILVYAILDTAWHKIRGHGSAKQRFATWFGVVLVLIAGFIVTALVSDYLKDYFGYPRPSAAISESINVVEHRDADDNHRSFPSGHATFITTMLIGLWPVLSKNCRIIGLWIVAGVCWSRIALGVHFPADVLGGFLIALVLVSLVRMFINWFFFRLFRLKFG